VVPALDFAACAPSPAPDVDLSGFECATAAVPLDWTDPGGEGISLAVVKHPAGDPARKVGTLFFNPGGPGGTATIQFAQWYDLFPADVKARFDIISWDPRGIGSSSPVQCYDSQDAEGEALASFGDYPTDEAAIAPFEAAAAAAGQACAQRNGELLAHVSTADTARDLDALRAAVGEDKLNYRGGYYCTFLGATYANLFPDSVRAMVLDGNLSPDNWTSGGAPATLSINGRIGSDRGAADNLQAFLTLCGQSSTDQCKFSAGSAEATTAKWQQLLDDLRAAPYTTASGSVVTFQSLSGQIGSAMDVVLPAPGAQGWSGSAAVLQSIWEALQQRSSAGSATAGSSTPSADPASEASAGATAPPAEPTYAGPEQIWAVMCGDAAVPPASAWPAIAEASEQAYGPLGAGLVWGDIICVDWPTKAAQPYAGPWDADTGVTALLIGNTHDPSTPYSNTEAVAEILPSTAVLTVEGYGHTMLLNPSSCGGGHESAYLIDGTLPPDGTVCQQDAAPFSS